MSIDWQQLPRDRFGDTAELNDELAALVFEGTKRATCSARAHYTEETLPKVGSRWVMEDSRGRPLAVVETTAIELRRYYEVDEAFARTEGEGDKSLAWWRLAHEAYFRREGVFAPDMPVVCEYFELVEAIDPDGAQ